MKKIFLIILLSMLLMYGSCKPKDDKNKYDPNKEIKITYYFEDDKTYDLVQTASEISLPECIITNIDDINNNSKYDYLFEELNEELSSNEYMFYIDWYKDKQHTEQISNNVNDDIILYGKISVAVAVDINKVDEEISIEDFKYFYCENNEELNLKSQVSSLIFDSNVTDEPIIKKIRFGSNIESLTNESNKEKFFDLNVKKLIIDSDFFKDYQIDKNIINKYDFCENDKLEEIVINGNIDYINKYAFFKCHNLKRININGKVIELDYNLFYELPLLEEINIADVEIIQNSFFW